MIYWCKKQKLPKNSWKIEISPKLGMKASKESPHNTIDYSNQTPKSENSCQKSATNPNPYKKSPNPSKS